MARLPKIIAKAAKANIRTPLDTLPPVAVNTLDALKKIPYGETRTYKDIAKAIGNEKASRAVGMANNKNNIPIIIPCHRVIGSNGSLVGYALGLDVKKYLLDLERKNKL